METVMKILKAIDRGIMFVFSYLFLGIGLVLKYTLGFVFKYIGKFFVWVNKTKVGHIICLPFIKFGQLIQRGINNSDEVIELREYRNNIEEMNTWEAIKLVPKYYFLFMSLLMDGIQFLVVSLAKLFMLILKAIRWFLRLVVKYVLKPAYTYTLGYVVKFFVWANKTKVGFIIFWPFVKLFTYVVLVPIRYFVKRYKGMSMEKKKAMTGYGFLSPWLIGVVALVIYPIGLLFYKSFNIVKQSGQDYNYTWIGFENYHRILRVDIDFMMEVQNFIVRVLLYTPVIIALAVIVAMLLNQNVKGKAVFRMIFFLPVIILNGELLSTMSDNGGMDIHLSPFVIDMITTVVPVFALDLFVDLFSIIIEILWYTGVPILIFLAMLQKIDKSLYEAASIDGANAWSIFWKITLPIIRPAMSVAVIFIVVFLANFDGNAINGIIIQSNGDPSRYQGYAAAMAFLYSVVQIFVIVILLLITRQRKSQRR